MLPKENTLPCAEAEAPIDKRDHFGSARQCHFNMTGHIIGPFEGVRKIGIVFGDEAINETLEISTRRRIGVFHNHQTAAGMAAKDSDRALA